MLTILIPHSPSILLALGLLGDPVAPLLPAHECGLELATRAGLTRHDAEAIIGQLELHSVSDDPEFLRVLFAVAYVESRFRQYRPGGIGTDRLSGVPMRSAQGAIGVLQVTLGAAEHIHVIRTAVGLREVAPTHKRLAQLPINVNYGSAYLWLALTETGGNWVAALTMYNGGYKQLTRLQRGDTVIAETSQYVLQVLNLSATCGQR